MGLNNALLRRCPFCGHWPFVVAHKEGYEIHCKNESCTAKPVIGFMRAFLSQADASAAWNNQKMTFDIDSLKKENVIIKKKRLAKIFEEFYISEEIWNEFLADIPYPNPFN